MSEGASATEIQTALIEAQPGSTIAFGEGTFHLTTDLSLTVDGVTIQGAGMDETTLSFKGQQTGAQGLLVTANHFTLRDIGIEDTKGDAVKILGGDASRSSARASSGPAVRTKTNGAYGLYPVQCKNVLIEDCVVNGASDAGIYVGQSNNIIVRDNRAELERRRHRDRELDARRCLREHGDDNTGGILVFNLPGLEVENGAVDARLRQRVFENNTTNFAPAGNIVGLVPTGTGIAILAAHKVEIFDNRIHDHKSVNIGIISYVPTGKRLRRRVVRSISDGDLRSTTTRSRARATCRRACSARC